MQSAMWITMVTAVWSNNKTGYAFTSLPGPKGVSHLVKRGEAGTSFTVLDVDPHSLFGFIDVCAYACTCMVFESGFI